MTEYEAEEVDNEIQLMWNLINKNKRRADEAERRVRWLEYLMQCVDENLGQRKAPYPCVFCRGQFRHEDPCPVFTKNSTLKPTPEDFK